MKHDTHITCYLFRTVHFFHVSQICRTRAYTQQTNIHESSTHIIHVIYVYFKSIEITISILLTYIMYTLTVSISSCIFTQIFCISCFISICSTYPVNFECMYQVLFMQLLFAIHENLLKNCYSIWLRFSTCIVWILNFILFLYKYLRIYMISCIRLC